MISPCDKLPAVKTILRFLLIATLASPYCLAQTGTVTFYSRSITVKSGAEVYLPKSEQPFGGLQGGWVLDGSQRLAKIRMGRFVTFHLTPGEHSFTDEGPTGVSKKPLVINVKDGGQYCVRLFAKMINLEVYGQWQNQIEEVPCQKAQLESAHLKPLDIKRVDPAVRAEVDSQSTFPSEIQSQH
jgi:hypothetical protein